MRLTAINLVGFKSFVDATNIRLMGSLVAVVGPNGCGKSNLIDAVRWVLGESSAKQLRGESMQDVIFNGAASRPRSFRAAVELVFDNADPEGAPQGAWGRYAEISVKRTLDRQGESAYFINRQSARKKDVTDLFLGTGVGKRGYAVIEQGMISRIVEAKPEELRRYLEEAAGVSKYKERRAETEAKLSASRANLDRLSALQRELDAQIRRLGAQAKAAARHRELSAALKAAQDAADYLRYLREDAESARAEREAQESDAALKALSEAAESLERKGIENENALDRARMSEAALAERRAALRERRAALEAKIESAREQARARARRLEETRLKRAALAEQKDEREAEIERLDDEWTEASLRLESADERIEGLEARLDDGRERWGRVEADAVQKRSELDEAERESQFLKRAQSDLNARRAETEAKLKEARDRAAAFGRLEGAGPGPGDAPDEPGAPDAANDPDAPDAPDALAAESEREAESAREREDLGRRLEESRREAERLGAQRSALEAEKDDLDRARRDARTRRDRLRDELLSLRARKMALDEDRAAARLAPGLDGSEDGAGQGGVLAPEPESDSPFVLLESIEIEPAWRDAVAADLRERLTARKAAPGAYRRIAQGRAVLAPGQAIAQCGPGAEAEGAPGGAGADPALERERAEASALGLVALADQARAAECFAPALRLWLDGAYGAPPGTPDADALARFLAAARPGARAYLPDGSRLDALSAAKGGDSGAAGVLRSKAQSERLGGEIARLEPMARDAEAALRSRCDALGELERALDRLRAQLGAADLAARDAQLRLSQNQARSERLAAQRQRRLAEIAQRRAKEERERAQRRAEEQRLEGACAALEESLGAMGLEAESLEERLQAALGRTRALEARHAEASEAKRRAQAERDEAEQSLSALRETRRAEALRLKDVESARAVSRERLASVAAQLKGLDEQDERDEREAASAAGVAADGAEPDDESALQSLKDAEAKLEREIEDQAAVSQALKDGQEQWRALKGQNGREIEKARALREKRALKAQEKRLTAQNTQAALAVRGADWAALRALGWAQSDAPRLQKEAQSLAAELDALGPVNFGALDELAEREAAAQNYADQRADLEGAIARLEGAIRDIDAQCKRLFDATFRDVNDRLGRIFPQLFGGGEARLETVKPAAPDGRGAPACAAPQAGPDGSGGRKSQGGAGDSAGSDGSPGSIGQAGLSAAEPSAGLGADARPLEEGVTILARPPGKKNSTIHQLSGGEKALAAMSLVFALFTLNPAPFCLLDEVDAPLDDVNTLRFCKLVEALSERTQFLYISHNQITMRMANQLLGVTQREKGVSRIVAVNLDEAVKMAG